MKKLLTILIITLLTGCGKSDSCEGVNCLNNGECNDGTCICPTGWTGEHCEIATSGNDCANITCLNGGVCVSGTCDCPSGYTGTNCQTPVVSDPCANVTCLNGGVCVSGICDCPSGYTGTNCQTPIAPTYPISLKINSVTVIEFPVNNNGVAWDFTSDPDIFVSINSGTTPTTSGYSSGYLTDCSYTQTHTFSSGMPVTIPSLTTNYVFGLWDYDPTSADELMGGLYTTFNSYKISTPSNITLSAGQIELKLNVTWIY